jgi:hypothetical protein
MNTRKKMSSRLALSTLLGLALAGAALALPAFAEDSGSDSTTDPMPLSYPFAAPGSLHVYHWTDYTRTDLAPGSAADQKRDNMMAEHKTPISDTDMTNVDPLALSYPMAAPGSLHVYHWTDYTRTDLAPGSVTDQRWDNMKKIAEHRTLADENGYWSREYRDYMAFTDPMPLSYPFAAPGSLHVYHWTDYTRTDLAPGSTEDQKWDNMKKTEEQNRNDSSTGR